MALNWEAISDNIINISQVLGEFLDTNNPQDVEWVYVDSDNTVKNIKLPNLGKAIKTIKDTAITPSELANTLKNYYKSVEVDVIKQAIDDNIDKHVNDLQSKIDNLDGKVNNEVKTLDGKITTNNTNITKKVNEVNTALTNEVKTTVMSGDVFEMLAENRRNTYQASGILKYGMSNSDVVNEDMWTRNTTNWPGINVLMIGYPFNDSQRVMDKSENTSPVVVMDGKEIELKQLHWGDPTFGTGAAFSLPEPATLKAVIDDSTKLPTDLEQSDIVLLKDTTRDLSPKHSNADEMINAWTMERGTINKISDDIVELKSGKDQNSVVHTKSDGKGVSDIYLIKGVKYRVEIEITDINGIGAIGTWTTGPNILQFDKPGKYVIDFKSNRESERLHIYSLTYGTDHYVRFKASSFKLTVLEETILTNTNTLLKAGIDIFGNRDNVRYFKTNTVVGRNDYVMLEGFEEDLDQYDIMNPNGLVHFTTQANNVDGVSNLVAPNFNGSERYYAFGTWQKDVNLNNYSCFKWSSLSIDDKVKLAQNPKHRIYKVGETWKQFKVRARTIKGFTVDSFQNERLLANGPFDSLAGMNIMAQGNNTTPSLNTDLYPYGSKYMSELDSNTFRLVGPKQHPYYVAHKIIEPGIAAAGHDNLISVALPLARVSRRNTGAYHKVFNPAGTAVFYQNGTGKYWYELPEGFVTSVADCFKDDNIAVINITDNEDYASLTNLKNGDVSSDKYKITGLRESNKSGREDGLFADIIDPSDVKDLRNEIVSEDYNVKLNDAMEKAIVGDLRGSEQDYELISIIGKNVWYGENSNESRQYEYAIYVSDGTDDYRIFNNGGLIPTPEGTIVNILTQNGETIKLIGKQNGKLKRATFGYPEIDYGMPFKNGNSQQLTMLIAVPKLLYKNRYITITDVIGDPRKLQNRVKYNTTKNNSGTVNLNDYIVTSKGEYYRALENRGKLADIEKDISSNSAKYVNLGNNGLSGGYRDLMANNKFNGRPLIVGERGESLLPIDGIVLNNNAWNDSPIEISKSEPSITVKLSRRCEKLKKVLVKKADGTYVEYILGYSSMSKFGANVGTGTKLIAEPKNRVYVNLSYKDLGYNSLDEALDKVVILVTYKTLAKVTKFADCENDKLISSSLISDVHAHGWSGDKIVAELIEKNPINISTPDYFRGPILRKQFTTHGGKDDNQLLNASWSFGHNEHLPLNLGQGNNNSVAGKFFTFLSEENGRAKVVFVYKEVAWTENPELSVSPGVYLNNKKIAVAERSYLVAYFNDDGKFIDYKKFDVYEDGANKYNGTKANSGVQAFIDYINAIPDGSIVAVSTYDEPRNNVYNNDKVKAALATVGANTDLLSKLEYRSSYGLIGIKTGDKQGTKLVESYKPTGGDPVIIEHDVGDNFKIKVISIGLNSKTTLDKSASWGDDNQFETYSSINFTEDLNGKMIAAGAKAFYLPFYIKKQ